MWTLGFGKWDLRELPSSFLKRKESKVRGENSDFAWTHGKWRGKVLEVLVILRKVKEETRWNLLNAWPAKSWSLGLINMQDTLALHVLNFNWLHVGEISTILSHASCLIKTPRMYLIT